MLRITTLGTLLLTDGDGLHTGPLARPRVRALLALLVRSGEAGMTRDRLCAFLWPESSPERARHSLDQVLYLVRKELGSGSTAASTDPVSLNAAALPSDVAEFATALSQSRNEDAAALYGGPFLDGFHLSNAPEFERWVDAERAALHRQYADALERAAVAMESRGDVDAAAAWWWRLAAAEPFSSRVLLSLMRALARAGDHGSALEAARVHELLLAQELGAAPDPAVTKLAAELRSQPPGPAAAVELDPHTKATVSVSPDNPHGAFDPIIEEPDSTRGSPVNSTRSRTRLRRARWRILAMLAAFAAAGLIASFALQDSPELAFGLPTVAVLPFTNETGDSALESVGRSASDWIAQGLIRTGLVRVVEPGLGVPVAANISGRIHRTRDTLWLQARVLTPASGEVAAVLDPVHTTAGDPAAALETLRKQILAVMGTMYDPRLVAWGSTALRPPSFEAFRAFAAALEEYAAGRFANALAGFARAAELDPQYAQPRLWAAWTNIELSRWPAADSILTALKSAATELSPLEGAWLDRIDARLRGDHERGFQAARRMVEVAPNSGWIIALHYAALDTRRPAVAREVLLDVPPETFGLLTWSWWTRLAWADHMLGEHRRELQTAEAGIRAAGRSWQNLATRARALAALGEEEALMEDMAELIAHTSPEWRDPGFWFVMVAYELRAHAYADAAKRALSRAFAWYDRAEIRTRPEAASQIAQLHYETGDDARADSIARTLLDTNYASTARGLLGLLAARRGDRAEADHWSAELARLERPYLFGDHTLWRAQIAAELGERTQAIELLRQAAAEGLDRHGWQLVHVLPEFDPLRQDPAFRQVVGPR